MRKERLATIGSALLLLSAVHCSIPDLASDGGKCPCAPGYSCDAGTCVPRGQSSRGAGGDSNGGGKSTGGTSMTGNAGGGGDPPSGGASPTGGSGGVGACGGTMPWAPNPSIDYDNYVCGNVCEVVSHDSILCCQNVHADGYTQPTMDAPHVGTLVTSPSWFACWLRGSTVAGTDIWYFTELDMLDIPANGWGFVSASALSPSGSAMFDRTDPSKNGLPECPCP